MQVRAWWCCTLHGLRAFSDVQRSAFRVRGEDRLRSSRRWIGEDGRRMARVAIISGNPRQDPGQGPSRFRAQALTVRKPVWAESVTLSRNGRPLDGLRADGLGAGDEVEAVYGMKLRASSADSVLQAAAEARCITDPGCWAPPLQCNRNTSTSCTRKTYCSWKQRAPSPTFKIRAAAALRLRRRQAMVHSVPAEYPEQKGQVELRAVAEQRRTNRRVGRRHLLSLSS